MACWPRGVNSTNPVSNHEPTTPVPFLFLLDKGTNSPSHSRRRPSFPVQRRFVATVGSRYGAAESLGAGAWYNALAEGKPRLRHATVAAYKQTRRRGENAFVHLDFARQTQSKDIWTRQESMGARSDSHHAIYQPVKAAVAHTPPHALLRPCVTRG